MSTPDEAVQAGLAAQAEDLGKVGPAAPEPVDVSDATPAAADPDELLHQIQEIEARRQAILDSQAKASADPHAAPVLDNNAPSYLHAWAEWVVAELAALRDKA